MKFNIQKENILGGLNAVIKATAARAIQPVLSNVLVETTDSGIKLSATDLDISIVVNQEASVENQGSITLPAKKLYEIISKLPEKSVEFTLGDNNLTKITCGKSKFDLFGISASEFPAINYPESEEAIEVEVEPLLRAIKQTVFAAATYDTNNVLSGVFCHINDESLEMAATDGNRLSRVIQKIENKNGKEFSAVIPSRTLVEFSRILSGVNDKTVLITVKSGQISFKLSDRCVASRILEGNYPKYQQLIPANYEIKAVTDRETLISSLDRTSTMVNERTSIIKFTFNEDTLLLSADTPDLGDSSDQIDVEYKDEELKIAFNYKYLLDVLKVIDSEKVKLELGGPLAAALVKPESEEDFLYLIMPVQIR